MHFGYPSEPPTLDPLAPAGAAASTRDILRPMLPALFSLDDRLRPRPDLVAAWPRKRDITTGPFTVRLELRRAEWSDGRAITSSDVRFSWQRLRAGPTGYRYRFLHDVQVLGPRTLRLHFDRPVRRWWALFSIDDMVLPAHAYSARWKDGPTVSGGPFVFAGWTRGLEIDLTRNERYWSKARVGAIKVEFVPEDETRLKLVQRRELDAFYSAGDANMGRRANAFGFERTTRALAGGPAASGAWAAAWFELDLDPDRIQAPLAAAIGEAMDPSLAAEIFEDSGQTADGIPARFPVPGARSENGPAVPGPWAGRGSIPEAKRMLAGGSVGRVIAGGGTATVSLAFDRDSGAAQIAGFVHFRLLPIGVRAELVGLDTADFEDLVASAKAPPAVVRLRRGADAPDAAAYVFGGLGSAETAADHVNGSEIARPATLQAEPVTGLDSASWTAAERDLAMAHTAYPLVRIREWIVGRGLDGPQATGTSSGPLWNAATWRFD